MTAMNDFPKNRCLLLILDGWGLGPAGPDNALSVANTPFLDRLMETCPHTYLECTGPAVGLPEGVMGNSEVGHLNIGAGRVVYQVLLRIDLAIRDGSFFENPALAEIMQTVRDKGSALHLMGLASDAGVHSQLAHLFALVEMAGRYGLERVYIHPILDGRDTPPDSGVGYVGRIQEKLENHPYAKIATLCGRYYAMDRDTRWDRTRMAYELYTLGQGEPETDPVRAAKNAYARGETDEFVKPVVITDGQGGPMGTVADDDGIIFYNFRPDRARQITRAFTEEPFEPFERTKQPKLSGYVTMTQFDESFDLPVAFGPVHLTNIVGEVISKNGLHQLRMAETEKYAHVTYFFNGGEETPFENEDRKLIPSPRQVRTYDEKPEMSAYEVAEEAVARLDSEKYDLIVINFANMDMVGHTGVMEAAVKAAEAVDACANKVVTCAREHGYISLVTADHGNSDQLREPDGSPHTAHTMNPVPFVLCGQGLSGTNLQHGVLGDIGPTIFYLMGIDQPEEMTGKNMIQT
ncbi:2,3-bisphosphoglycerate-independent phosphoglycerate mutase [Desulfosalsimonas propionicica]|uniref:2,3-bisphosphoglycerate-independent phosphoglycerate mutase n=1 Tax=Desulfosalsimonas propionicica TaxID=332175 RepID=A0A7W0C6B8_9BACT|nr:2,3-bisphosphoglycerate-independent phosphoglycerate mutase [Desulfosalsimonas propionicica]MBA2879984.1 2,3-bisphosphoglycerate-independent phosphoglycerate mutase [Desulfosalsimonas propionicica]